MVDILQCTFCKRPFQSLGRKICPECLEQIDKDFFVVRDYIFEHKQTNIDKVSEETGVSKQVILYLLKEGRLIIDDGGDTGGLLKCEVCKKAIKSGRMCERCKEQVAGYMSKSIQTHQAESAKNDNASFKGTAKLKSR